MEKHFKCKFCRSQNLVSTNRAIYNIFSSHYSNYSRFLTSKYCDNCDVEFQITDKDIYNIIYFFIINEKEYQVCFLKNLSQVILVDDKLRLNFKIICQYNSGESIDKFNFDPFLNGFNPTDVKNRLIKLLKLINI